jgi:hypothetical protein
MGQWYGKALLAASWSEREPKVRAELAANKAKLAGYSDDRDLSQKIEEAKTRLENQKALCDQDKINACPPGVRRRFPCELAGLPMCQPLVSYRRTLQDLQDKQARNERQLQNLRNQIASAETEISTPHENIRSPGDLVELSFANVTQVEYSRTNKTYTCRGQLNVKLTGSDPADLGSTNVIFAISPNLAKAGDYTVEVAVE